MRSLLLRLLLVLVLVPGLASCIPDDLPSGFGLDIFRFLAPAEDGLVLAEGTQFSLQLPEEGSYRQLRIALDGKRLKKQKGRSPKGAKQPRWTVSGGQAQGTLATLAPGLHLLSAELRFRIFKGFELPLSAWTVFEVVEPASFSVRESVEQLHVTHAAAGREPRAARRRAVPASRPASPTTRAR